MTYPDYEVHWKTGEGCLRADFKFNTPVTDQIVNRHGYIDLDPDGVLHLAEGYVWDFGSGPAIDTPDMVYASLAHDAFYELMQLNMIPWSLRKQVDRYFKRLLKEAGMGKLRRQWVYLGVRLGYPISQLFKRR
jgi:hypothetical protein